MSSTETARRADASPAATVAAAAAAAADAGDCEVQALERHGGARLRERRAALVQALQAHRAEAVPWLPRRRPRQEGSSAEAAPPQASGSPMDLLLAPLDVALADLAQRVRARPWPWLAGAAGAGAAIAALRPQRLLRVGAAWFVPLALNDLRHFVWAQGKGAVGRVLQGQAQASDAPAPR